MKLKLSFLFLVAYSCSVSAITGPTHGKVVVCYVSTWAVYRPNQGSFSLEHIDPTLCTHLIYSFAGLNTTTNSIKSLDPWQDLTEDYGKGGYNRMVRLKERYPYLKVTLAIGGWNEGSKNYSLVASDPRRRSEFVKNALTFVRKYNFDGLDLDWEFPGKRGGDARDKENFLLLVKELRAAFNKYNLLLTAAFGAGEDTINVAYDVAGLSVYLDYIHMMCYDYHGAWDGRIGPNAPLKGNDIYTISHTVKLMLKLGANPNKLVLGIPLYGRTFLMTSSPPTNTLQLRAPAQNVGFQGPYTKEDGFMGYNEICIEVRNSSQWTRHWHDESQTPFAISGEKVISYDDQQSIKAKVKLAMEMGLAGCMVWSLDTDDFRGDCSNEDGFTNFPLMRTINKAIEDTLRDIEMDKQNKIPDGDDDTNSKSDGCVYSMCNFMLIVMGFAYFIVRIEHM